MDERPQAPEGSAPALEPGDFYMEGPNLVFTAAYHRRRGYCCGSGCRHCPYREDGEEGADHEGDQERDLERDEGGDPSPPT